MLIGANCWPLIIGIWVNGHGSCRQLLIPLCTNYLRMRIEMDLRLRKLLLGLLWWDLRLWNLLLGLLLLELWLQKLLLGLELLLRLLIWLLLWWLIVIVLLVGLIVVVLLLRLVQNLWRWKIKWMKVVPWGGVDDLKPVIGVADGFLFPN